MVAQLRSCRDGRVHEGGVEHRAADHPVRPCADAVDDPAGRGAEAQPRHGGRRLGEAVHAEGVEQVEDGRGDAVAAGLVAGERGGVEEQHARVGAPLQRPQRRGRACGARAHDRDVVHPATPCPRCATTPVRAADTFPGRGSGHYVSVPIITGASGNVGPAPLR